MAINNKNARQFHRAFHQSKIYINHTHSTQHIHTQNVAQQIETLYKRLCVYVYVARRESRKEKQENIEKPMGKKNYPNGKLPPGMRRKTIGNCIQFKEQFH